MIDTSFQDAWQKGIALADQEHAQKLAQENVDRERELKLADLEIRKKQLKFEQQLQEHGVALKNYELASQRPTEFGGLNLPAMPGSQTQDSAVPTGRPQAPLYIVPPTIIPNDPISFPAVGDQAGFSATPPRMEEVLRRHAAAVLQEKLNEAALKPTSTPEGGTTTFGVPGVTPTSTVTGQPKESDWTPETVTINGKGPRLVLKNKQGMFIDPNTRDPIAGTIDAFRAPDKPQQETTSVVQFQDPVTKEWIVGRMDQAGNVVRAKLDGSTVTGTAGKLTGLAANRAVAAASIESITPDLIKKIEKNKAKLGALVGKGENFLLKQGIKDPELRDLQSSLKSMAPLLSTLHGGRNTEYLMKEFEDASARLGEDPANAIAALKAQLAVAKSIKNAQDEVLGLSPSGAAPSPGAVPASEFDYVPGKGLVPRK